MTYDWLHVVLFAMLAVAAMALHLAAYGITKLQAENRKLRGEDK